MNKDLRNKEAIKSYLEATGLKVFTYYINHVDGYDAFVRLAKDVNDIDLEGTDTVEEWSNLDKMYVTYIESEDCLTLGRGVAHYCEIPLSELRKLEIWRD